jgi:hypothetical protein
MKRLLRLYPAWWRRRYGTEALAILEGRPTTFAYCWDLVLGAIDAWLGQKMPPNGTVVSDKGLRESPESSSRQEPLVYERYGLPPPLLQPMLIGYQPPWAGDRRWEWKEYLGVLWLPWLLVVLLVSQWLSDRGIAAIAVQVTAVAACFGLYLAQALVDLSGKHWAWRKGLVWLWPPVLVALAIIAGWLDLTAVATLAGLAAVLACFRLITRGLTAQWR